MHSPVLISVYHRQQHLKNCIDSLLKCPESPNTVLYIASDAPFCDEHKHFIDSVREYVGTISGFKRVVSIFRPINLGGHENIVQAMVEIFDEYDSLILLEDDVEVGKGFLTFMNSALEMYKFDSNVVGVCSYLPPGVENQDNEPFFLQSRTPYGMGVWKSKELAILECLNQEYVKSVVSDFSFFKKFEATHPHVARAIPLMAVGGLMFGDIVTAIKMQDANLLAIYPPKSISASRGNDGSGVHSGVSSRLQKQIVSNEKYTIDGSISPVVDENMQFKFSQYYRFPFVGVLNYLIYICNKIPGFYYFYKKARKFIKWVKSKIVYG